MRRRNFKKMLVTLFRVMPVRLAVSVAERSSAKHFNKKRSVGWGILARG
jgi:hypothetical protein